MWSRHITAWICKTRRILRGSHASSHLPCRNSGIYGSRAVRWGVRWSCGCVLIWDVYAGACYFGIPLQWMQECSSDLQKGHSGELVKVTACIILTSPQMAIGAWNSWSRCHSHGNDLHGWFSRIHSAMELPVFSSWKPFSALLWFSQRVCHV